IEVSLARGAVNAVELPPFDSVAKSTSETIGSDDTLRAIRLSGGTGLSADEGEIRRAVSALAEEGLNVEASAALPVACLPKLCKLDTFHGDQTGVGVLPASGLRWSEPTRHVSRRVVDVGTIAEFERVLDAA